VASAVTTLVPSSREEVEELAGLPGSRAFTAEFSRLWPLGISWIASFYDALHLARAAHWVLRLDPLAPEALVIAALTHDMERSVPGGPVIDKRTTPWDDPAYNRAHCVRSAEIVQAWLRGHGACQELLSAVERPILEHEFGGSPEGDLVQAADSLSFLEIYLPRVLEWIGTGECDLAKGEAKVEFMFTRIRRPDATEIARPFYDRFLKGLAAAA
jgi:hypothetical protein